MCRDTCLVLLLPKCIAFGSTRHLFETEHWLPKCHRSIYHVKQGLHLSKMTLIQRHTVNTFSIKTFKWSIMQLTTWRSNCDLLSTMYTMNSWLCINSHHLQQSDSSTLWKIYTIYAKIGKRNIPVVKNLIKHAKHTIAESKLQHASQNLNTW